MVLKYISLFSGIGGFEVAIHRLYPRAVCVGYSEIDPKAIAAYSRNFPTHTNFGDIRVLTKSVLDAALAKSGGCDLLVAGFPCNDLSSVNGMGKGLEGPQSGLFYDMVRVIKVLKKINPKLDIVIENNATMANKWKHLITQSLRSAVGDVYVSLQDSSRMVVQKRKRVFWTTKPISEFSGKRVQSWKDVLQPVQNTPDDFHASISKRKNSLVSKVMNCPSRVSVKVKGSLYTFASKDFGKFKTRWTAYSHDSDTSLPYSRTIMTQQTDCILIDRRGCPPGQFRMRRYTVKELARLFTFDDDHLPEGTSVNTAYGLFGKAVVVKVVEHVLGHVLKN
jgi:DNA-cytosine methyltransferase